MIKDYQKWFVHDRFGMFIHWGLFAVPARHEWLKNLEKLNDEQYQRFFDAFNPDMFDPKAWAKAAKDAGMKYFVVTTKHHEGFCMFDSHYTDFKITNTAYGKDAIREIVDAFRAEGIKVGLYHSLIDWHHPDYVIDSVNYPSGLGKTKEELAEMNKGRDQKKYIKYLHDSVRQLLTEYGKIDIIWFDFSFPEPKYPTGKGKDDWDSETLVKMIRELQPGILINNRLDLPDEADILTPEQVMPDEKVTKSRGATGEVWEGCQTFSGPWGYGRDFNNWKSPKQCIDLLINHVCRDGNLLMNVGPNGRGYIEERAMERLAAYAKWMKYHSSAIYGCGMAPAEYPEPRDCRYTYNQETGQLFLHVMNWPCFAIHLKNMYGKLKFAKLMLDGSEIGFSEDEERNTVTLKVPIIKPDTEVPVIELFLK
ncbi:MAG: alpha-L-fucosidase [Lentisphaeria bacterium]|nr:alpha-L-fucosidase [Lentisphaeria bacterium]